MSGCAVEKMDQDKDGKVKERKELETESGGQRKDKDGNWKTKYGMDKGVGEES